MAFQNISQLLSHTAETFPSKGVTYYPSGLLQSEGQFVSYRDLLQTASARAQQIKSWKLDASRIILIHFSEQRDSIEWFWAVTLAGHTPAISTPFSRNERQRELHIQHLADLLNDPICLTTRALQGQFGSRCPLRLHFIDDIQSDDAASNHDVSSALAKSPTNPASLMLTSGSSGKPKAVIVSHDMIMHCVKGKSGTLSTSSTTPFLNWIGLDHVACLTEIHLHAMWLGANQVHVQALDLMSNPIQFLHLVEKHKVMYSFAPHFFLASLKKSWEDAMENGDKRVYDLSSLRAFVTGGEANVVDTCVGLLNLLVQGGASPGCIQPTFGMSETGAGAVYNTDFPVYDVKRLKEFACTGKPIEGHYMRTTDNFGNICPADVIGNLEVSGPTVFKEYYNNTAATVESFTDDGWFKTGDTAIIDQNGMLTLVGRSKELIIINGVNFSPVEIESVVEDVDGTASSYTAVVPYRAKGAETEGLAIVYLPTYDRANARQRVDTNNMLAKLVMLHTGVRPLIIPLDEKALQKSTLGKLSRSKISKSLANGEYSTFTDLNESESSQFLQENFRRPQNEMERLVLKVICETLDLLPESVGANQNIFALGVNSIDLIKVKSVLQEKAGVTINLLTVMVNPTVESLAAAVRLSAEREYDPMVVLQDRGSKTPLWLIHPGVGEVLVFLPLSSYITDRPIYALRARGFEINEKPFDTWQEARDIYLEKIKSVQPEGPYAIAGYSYGSMIAFELAKGLQQEGREVKFLGVFNLPPHIKTRMRQLDWTNCILHLSYFLGFFKESIALKMHPILQKKSHEDVITWILQTAPPERVLEVGLDRARLTRWAEVAFSLQHSAIDYEPSGEVECMDVFAAIPLAAVADSFEDWKENHLRHWKDFSHTAPKLHEVEGAHYTMLSPTYVGGFQRKLKQALADRGI